MADHDKPGISDTYVNVLADLDARMEDQAKGFDPATTTPTNLKTGSVRWSSASKKWQLWSGSAWNDLAAEYAINVSGAAGKLKTARNFSLTGGATAAAVGFDGTSNVTLNVTALDGTKVSAATTSAKGAVQLADGPAITAGAGGLVVDAAQLKAVKDSIPAAQVNADWNASSGVAAIVNKPTLGTAAFKNVGTESGQVPLNSSLGTAAFKNAGTGPTDVALYGDIASAVTSGEQLFSVSGTFTAPKDGVYDVWIVGGGGNGGDGDSSKSHAPGGGGGGAGKTVKLRLSLTGGIGYAVVVGAAGSGSSFDGTSAPAGDNGGNGSATSGGTGGAGYPTGGNGSLYETGGAGAPGFLLAGHAGGTGKSGIFGVGGGGVNGDVGCGYGGGGGGGSGQTGVSSSRTFGGSGYQGCVYIRW